MKVLEVDKINKNFLTIRCQYSDKENVKMVSDAKWDPERKVWMFPARMVKVKALKDIFPDLVVSDDVYELINKNKEINQKALEIKNMQDCDLEIEGLKTKPFSYQKVGIKFMLMRDEAANFCELGTGKTLQTLAAVIERKNNNQIKKCLVVCPSSVKYNWGKEIEKHTNEKYIVVDGSKNKRVELYEEYKKDEDILFLIINYEMLRCDIDVIRKYLDFDAIIGDESVKLKNPLAQQTKAMKYFVNKKYKYILSGYPIANNAIDIWSQIDFLLPGYLGSYWSFEDTYVDRGYFGEITGYRNLDQLKKKLEPLYIRFLKKDVLDLPDKVYESRVVSLEKDQLMHYEQMRDELRVYIEKMSEKEVITETKDILTKLIRLSQITSGFVTDERLNNPFTMKYNAKLDALEEIVEEVINNNKPIVIWCRFIPTVNLLMEVFGEKYKVASLTGATPTKKRQEIIDDFQNGKLDIFIGQILAGGMGINLYKSDTEVFFEKAFLSPSNIIQAEDRCVISGTLISTPDGFKKIDDLKIGDLVLTHRGRYQPIEKIYKRNYDSEMIDLNIFKNKQHLIITPEHPILIFNKNTKKEEWREAKNLSCNDYIAYPKIKKNKRKIIYKFKNPEKYFMNNYNKIQSNGRLILLPKNIEISSDDFLYIAGWFLAEGWLPTKYNKSVNFCFRKSTEMKYAYKIKKIIQKLFNINGQIYKSKIHDSVSLCFKSKSLYMLFLQLFGTGAKFKSIPQCIMNLNKNKTKIILQSALLGDGYYRNNHWTYCTISQKLAYQIRELMIDNGFFPTLQYRLNNHNNLEYYISAFSNEKMKNEYRNKTISNKNYIFNKIFEVKKYLTSRIKVYNLKIKDDETFCTEFQCVHNCHRIGQINKVTIISLIANNTIDMRWEKLCEKKRDIADQILGDKAMVVNKQMVLDLLDK